MAREVVLAGLLLTGCVGPSDGQEPLLMGPMDDFAAEVQPHLAERCGSGGCHALLARPLSFYVPGAYRADPERTYLDEPLTDWELRQNAQRFAAFAHDSAVNDSDALCKPLAERAGGCWHGGGVVFEDATDPGYQALRGWLRQRAAGGVP